MTGITRVTLKKRDGLIFVINDPEVLKSGTNDNSFAVFGELKLEDPNARLQTDEAKKFKDRVQPAATSEAKADESKKEEDKKEGDNEAPESEEGITPNHIEMVMQHANCTRNVAIRALREAKDDMVEAVMKLTNA